ncbi:MobQ family relaxase [Xanthomonas euvesicatoria]|nr:MobQ family relaxase [Xanthomonas euvesicatoria]MCC8726156.1 MobA/MobL family protein [Xanthomonas euvesicatoria pv. euvesicatoria]MCC8747360.1 MobA/MobL family protein [Xanthomonas euvesicatoria pv. euvesicatoria]MCC8755735.1 MobA/MobL family protein [Xanthomonas euvesicatoria pv. euvesicatoria]MDC9669526.1 MobA/MobL family protein [Xanthomonas euvesicatoria]MDW7699343.1 MobQ family relaxase [Xanthomonas euvesicatoria]
MVFLCFIFCGVVGVAIYHCEINSISRAKGHSATAAAAYRAGIRIEDDRLGVIQDYTKRSGVASFEILAPSGSPAWIFDPSRLWNAAEAAETRSNARVAREMEIALPCELTELQREELARDIGRQLVDRYNAAVQIAIHTPDKHGDQRNHHAHILFTSRQVGAAGLNDYAAKVFDDFKQGPKEVLYWREQVASITNEHLKNAGHDVRVDHRTLEAQAMDAAKRGDVKQARELDRLPTVKEGCAPARRRHARIRNAKIREENEVRQREWDQMEIQANNEARLMPAHHDRKPGENNNEDGARTVARSRARRSRKGPAPLTSDSVNTDRLRVDGSGRKPVLSVSPSHRVAVVQSRWSPERGRHSLRSTFEGHSGDGGTLHFTSSTVIRGSSLTKISTVRALGAVAKPAFDPSQPARVARGTVAPKGALKIFSSAPSGGDGNARISVTGSEYDRRMMQSDQERLDMEADAARQGRQRDAEVKALLESLTALEAMHWRDQSRRIAEARAWLSTYEHEEQQRFAERERRKRVRDTEWARLQEWKQTNPEPWKFFPKHKHWVSALEERTKPLRTADIDYKLAKTNADLPALQKLGRERIKMQRQLARATTARQAIAMLPSEHEEQITLPIAPPPPIMEPQRDTLKVARSRWARFPVLNPPGYKRPVG